MRRGVYLLITFTVITTAGWTQSFHISESSTIVINGTSNVSDFRCQARELDIESRVIYSDRSNYLNFQDPIAIPVEKFTCDNPVMTRDFRELLKWEENEYIILRFDSILVRNNKGVNSGKGRIKLSGVENLYSFNFNIMNLEDSVNIEGTKVLKMTDFHIEPPSRLMGLIKVEDLLIIDFKFVLK